MSQEDLKNKFFNCASYAARPYPEGKLEEIYDLIFRFEELEDVNQLFRLL